MSCMESSIGRASGNFFLLEVGMSGLSILLGRMVRSSRKALWYNIYLCKRSRGQELHFIMISHVLFSSTSHAENLLTEIDSGLTVRTLLAPESTPNILPSLPLGLNDCRELNDFSTLNTRRISDDTSVRWENLSDTGTEPLCSQMAVVHDTVDEWVGSPLARILHLILEMYDGIGRR